MNEYDPTFRTKDVEKALTGLLASDDIAKFIKSFGSLVALFRLNVGWDASDRPKAAQDYIARVRELAEALQTELGRMPPSVKAYVMDAAEARGTGDLLGRMEYELMELDSLVWAAEQEIPVSAGRPGSGRRDALLVEVVRRLEGFDVPEEVAVKAAAKCLTAARVQLPAGTRAIADLYERAVEELGKKGQENS